MAIQIKQQQGVTYLAIQDDITIYSVNEQKNTLYAHLKAAKELQIDLGGVTEIDGAGVQMLMFLKREAKSRNIKLSLTQHSQPVVEVLELLNLSNQFGDPIVIAADWKST